MRTLFSLCLLLAMFGNAAADPNVKTWSELRHERLSDPALWRVRAFMRRYSLPMIASDLTDEASMPPRTQINVLMLTPGRALIQEDEEEKLGLGDLE